MSKSINSNNIKSLIIKIIIYFIGTSLLLCGIVVMIYATYPIGEYYLFSLKSDDQDGVAVRLSLEKDNIDQGINVDIPEDNKLIIKKIGVDANIVEGDGSDALWHGVWRFPTSAIPGDKGNVVISGHRFQFVPPNNKTFYLLDKLEPGDNIRIFWHNKSFDYLVEKKYEVDPDEIDILKKGHKEKLTLLTCSPLFTQNKRLIIEALPRNLF